MDSIMQTLAALLVALGAASGSPVDTAKSSDRPAIVAPIPASSQSNDKSNNAATTEINGTVTSFNGNVIVVDGMTITLDKNAQVNGVLKAGAMVQIEGVKQADGTMIAREISVGATDKSKDKSGSSVSSSDDKNKGTSISTDKDKSTGSDDKSKGLDNDKSKDSDDKGKGSDDKGKSSDDKGKDDSHEKESKHDGDDD
ncbi:hypothetical protein ANRL1_04276 [Anaerolineae bacterium]|nr:hypothetical protein ANRL1_04276 [Anaerolineae bacterium]